MSISGLLAEKHSDASICVSTLDEKADRQFVKRNLTYISDKAPANKNVKRIFNVLQQYMPFLNAEARYTYRNFRKSVNKFDSDTVFISIGGDNYCCEKPAWLYYLNSIIDKKKCKRVLFGCTIEEKWLGARMIKDLDGYSVITARDMVSYHILEEKLKKAKVIYMPDTAFCVKPMDVDFEVLPKTIGINLSPFATKKGKSAQLKSCYSELIEHILKQTDYNVLLIPHVYIPGNDDRDVLRELYQPFENEHRVSMIQKEYSYAELRTIISRLSMLVCARTHASISGYATCVPTLVLGYSGKSHQISYELFGTDEGYVMEADEELRPEVLINAVDDYLSTLSEKKKRLEECVPSYMKLIHYPEEIDAK